MHNDKKNLQCKHLNSTLLFFRKNHTQSTCVVAVAVHKNTSNKQKKQPSKSK